jgi:hypothetical protein
MQSYKEEKANIQNAALLFERTFDGTMPLSLQLNPQTNKRTLP